MRPKILQLIAFYVIAALLPPALAGRAACAQESTNEEIETMKIERLIEAVRTTPEGTKFIRNGTEHGAEKAAQHLRRKYGNAKKYAKTAELFIENIASKSYLTDEEYRIKFPDGKLISAREFFIERLKNEKPDEDER